MLGLNLEALEHFSSWKLGNASRFNIFKNRNWIENNLCEKCKISNLFGHTFEGIWKYGYIYDTEYNEEINKKNIIFKNDKKDIYEGHSKITNLPLNLKNVYGKINLKNGELLWSKTHLTSFNSQIKIYKDKFYVVDYENQSDLKVFKVDYPNQVDGNKGLWYFVDYPNQSDKKIYFVDYPNQSDLKVFFVKYKNQSGWRNKSKQYLFYWHYINPIIKQG